jgi:hypothetical protein
MMSDVRRLLLSNQPTGPQQVTPPARQRAALSTTTKVQVSARVPIEVKEGMDQMAYYERKTLQDLVSEILWQGFQTWKLGGPCR